MERDYRITIDGRIVDDGQYTDRQKQQLLDGVTTRTIRKSEIKTESNITHFFLADDQEYKLDKRSTTTEQELKLALKAKIADSPSFMYRIILSEHVDGGMGNAGGSKLLETYYQLNGAEVTEQKFNETIYPDDYPKESLLTKTINVIKNLF